jgi:hypothetical protein
MKPTTVLLTSLALGYFDIINLARVAGQTEAFFWGALMLINLPITILAAKEVVE